MISHVPEKLSIRLSMKFFFLCVENVHVTMFLMLPFYISLNVKTMLPRL